MWEDMHGVIDDRKVRRFLPILPLGGL